MNNFPPQAYTRDVLAAAYEWVRKQPLATRELAQDSNTLVALYLQARRRGQIQSNAQAQTNTQANPSSPGVMISTQAPMSPSTVESFKQELKTLTEGLKQFEGPAGASAQAYAPAPVTTSAPLPHNNKPTVESFNKPAVESLNKPTVESFNKPMPEIINEPTTVVEPPARTHTGAGATARAPMPPHNSNREMGYTVETTQPQTNEFSLDGRSMQTLYHVKNKLNLSSDAETLRLLIALGFDKIREILPK